MIGLLMFVLIVAGLALVSALDGAESRPDFLDPRFPAEGLGLL